MHVWQIILSKDGHSSTQIHIHTYIHTCILHPTCSWYNETNTPPIKRWCLCFLTLHLGRDLGFLRARVWQKWCFVTQSWKHTAFTFSLSLPLPRSFSLSPSLPSFLPLSLSLHTLIPLLSSPASQSYWNTLALSPKTPQSRKFMAVYPMLRESRSYLGARTVSSTGQDYLV